jgi:hypothetical protein
MSLAPAFSSSASPSFTGWKLRLTILLIVLIGAGPAAAVSPWTPEPGHLSTTASVVYQVFDSLYEETHKVDFDPDADGDSDELGQITTTFSIEYGIIEDVSFDASIGYTRTFSSTIEKVADVDLADAEGLDDVELGVTWRFLDEFDWEEWYVPSLALRVGAIIKGSYDDTFFPASPGDKGTGYEIELGVGKVLESGFGVSSIVGFRDRDNGVPPDLHFRADGFYSIPDVLPGYLDSATVSLAYDYLGSTKGDDLGGPTFKPEKAGRLKEREQLIEVGLGLQDVGGRYYSLFYGRTLDGRNTGEKDIFGASITLPWELPHL